MKSKTDQSKTDQSKTDPIKVDLSKISLEELVSIQNELLSRQDEIKEFQDSQTEAWKKNVLETCPTHLNLNLLEKTINNTIQNLDITKIDHFDQIIEMIKKNNFRNSEGTFTENDTTFTVKVKEKKKREKK